MVAELLGAGHDAASVMNDYSIDEIEAHYHSLLRVTSIRRLDFIRDLMAGSGNMARQPRRRHIRSLMTTGERIHRVLKAREKTQQERLFDDLASMRAKKREEGNADNRRVSRKHRP